MAPFYLEADTILVKGGTKVPGPGGEELRPGIPVGIQKEGDMITIVKAMKLGVGQEVAINTVRAWPVVRFGSQDVLRSSGLVDVEKDLAEVLGRVHPISREVRTMRFSSRVFRGRILEIENVTGALGKIRWEKE